MGADWFVQAKIVPGAKYRQHVLDIPGRFAGTGYFLALCGAHAEGGWRYDTGVRPPRCGTCLKKARRARRRLLARRITTADARFVQKVLRQGCRRARLPGLAPVIQVHWVEACPDHAGALAIATAHRGFVYPFFQRPRTLATAEVKAVPYPFEIHLQREWWFRAAEYGSQDSREEVILHELAHLICSLRGVSLGVMHGREFGRVHAEVDTPRAKRRATPKSRNA